MDPERWPEFIRAFVDNLGAKHGGVIVAVDYSDQIWTVTAGCPRCGTHVTWGLLGPAPRELALATTIPIPEPAWYAKLADLPPGGSA